jgi:hypothetical protein
LNQSFPFSASDSSISASVATLLSSASFDVEVKFGSGFSSVNVDVFDAT